jgi:hypothetical protein
LLGVFFGLMDVLISSPAAGDGALETIRSDVRTEPPSNPSPPAEPTRRDSCPQEYRPENQGWEEAKSNFFMGALMGAGVVITSPFWGPRVLLQDESLPGIFPRYPYDHTPGFLLLTSWPGQTAVQEKPLVAERIGAGIDPNALPYAALVPPAERMPAASPESSTPAPVSPAPVKVSRPPVERNWACQLRADYLDEFAAVSGIGGQMIFETASRWGFDGAFEHLRERLPGDNADNLTLGDANLVYRFAQSEKVQLRTGIGMNWLNDARRTDLGFNFTYGGDFFPRKPWALSAAVDWGTLGHAGLFRFRATAGILVNRFETYAGYEYGDIGRTQENFLVAGVRIWF